jgi:hypothetical protein
MAKKKSAPAPKPAAKAPALVPKPAATGPTYQGKPIQDGVTYQLNDAGNQVAGIAKNQINPAANAKQGASSQSKNVGVKLAIRQAGEGGITKKELNNITKTTGKSAATVIRRLDQVNSNLKSKDLARIGLNSGAANMLIKQNEKQSGYDAYLSMLGGKPKYGSGQIGKTLQSMMGSPGIPTRGGGTMGATAGFNPGGNPTKNRMIGGTQIRGGGNIADRGFGQQYTQPAATPAPAAVDPTLTDTAPIDQTPLEPLIPEKPPEEKLPSGPGMLSGGGAGAAGANRLGRAKSRLRQLGIYGRGTGLLGRGLQYGNTLNIGR